MAGKIDLTGQRFGRLVVIGDGPRAGDGYQRVVCRCDCGVERIVRAKDLRGGNTKSCGCFKRDRAHELKYKPLDGQHFGWLVVMGLSSTLGGSTRLECRCACGNTVYVDRSNLTAGRQTSCGCQKISATRAANTTHGMSKTVIYQRWHQMVRRCTNETDKHYPLYGGRGIKVCDRWCAFENFYADMGDPPKGMTLDRIDVNGNYCPENCRWASPTQQARNRRRTTMLTFHGETLPLTEWAERKGVAYYVIHGRIKGGWTVEKALTTPVMPR